MVPTLIYAYATLFLVSLQLPCYRCQIMYVSMYVTEKLKLLTYNYLPTYVSFH